MDLWKSSLVCLSSIPNLVQHINNLANAENNKLSNVFSVVKILNGDRFALLTE